MIALDFRVMDFTDFGEFSNICAM